MKNYPYQNNLISSIDSLETRQLLLVQLAKIGKFVRNFSAVERRYDIQPFHRDNKNVDVEDVI